jgi:hypothetical protein
MNALLLQTGGAGQTLALVCFGIAILALLWVYRRGQARASGRGNSPAQGVTEHEQLANTVATAQAKISSINEQERWDKLQRAKQVPRRPSSAAAAPPENRTTQQTDESAEVA